MSAFGVLADIGGAARDDLERTWRVLDKAGCGTIYVPGDLTLCAAVATHTRSARICCLLPSGDPQTVSKAAGTLRFLSDDRFALGLGPLRDDSSPFGQVARAERLAEEVIARAAVPVVVCGDGPAPRRLAAQLGHGWVSTAAPEQFRHEVQHLRSSAGRPDRLRCSVIAPEDARPEAYPGADEVVFRLSQPPISSAEDVIGRWMGVA